MTPRLSTWPTRRSPERSRSPIATWGTSASKSWILAKGALKDNPNTNSNKKAPVLYAIQALRSEGGAYQVPDWSVGAPGSNQLESQTKGHPVSLKIPYHLYLSIQTSKSILTIHGAKEEDKEDEAGEREQASSNIIRSETSICRTEDAHRQGLHHHLGRWGDVYKEHLLYALLEPAENLTRCTIWFETRRLSPRWLSRNGRSWRATKRKLRSQMGESQMEKRSSITMLPAEWAMSQTAKARGNQRSSPYQRRLSHSQRQASISAKRDQLSWTLRSLRRSLKPWNIKPSWSWSKRTKPWKSSLIGSATLSPGIWPSNRPCRTLKLLQAWSGMLEWRLKALTKRAKLWRKEVRAPPYLQSDRSWFDASKWNTSSLINLFHFILFYLPSSGNFNLHGCHTKHVYYYLLLDACFFAATGLRKQVHRARRRL